MKIMIVDDEALVRIGLIAIFEGCERGYQIIEASDGKQALDIYNQKHPDIVFVDISMPVMDGLKFISLAKNSGYESKFVILTCHDELHMLRKAIQTGVHDYIIKTSFNKDEMLELVDKIEKEIPKPNESSNIQNEDSYKEHALSNIIKNIINSGNVDQKTLRDLINRYSISFLEYPFAVLAVFSRKLFKMLTANNKNGNYLKYKSNLNRLVNTLVEEYYGGYCSNLEDDTIIVFLSFNQKSKDTSLRKDFVEEFCIRLIKSAETYLNIDLYIGVYMEGLCSKIPGSVMHSRTALKKKFYDIGSTIYFYDHALQNYFPKQELDAFKEKAVYELNSMKYGSIITLLEDFRSLLINFKGENIDDIYNTFIQLFYILIQHVEQHYKQNKEKILNSSSDYRLIISCDNAYELIEIYLGIINNIMQTTQEENESYYTKIIYSAKTYILEHISEEIDLAAVSKYVNLSPNYFSKLFKEKTGEKFVDYVVKVKIEKAKKYIEKGEKVFSAAEKVGYNNYSYFCRVFKAVTGMRLREIVKK